MSSISYLGMYEKENKNLFEERLEHNYDKVAFGKGERAGDDRIYGIWIFYNTIQIVTHEYHKYWSSPDSKSSPSEKLSFNGKYSNEEFEEYIKNKKLHLSEQINLCEILRDWDKCCILLKLRVNHHQA